MANNTTTQASYIQGDPQEDDCRENVPPSDPNAMDSSKLEKAELRKVEIFTSQLEEENGNVFDARVFSTPAAKNENSAGQVKSRVSVFQSALTPILKYLNIGNKSSSPESFQNQGIHNFPVPFNIPSTNCEKSTTELRRVVNVGDCSMIINECLPEITLLDVTADSMIQLTTNDSVLPESKSSTPQFYGERKPTQTSSPPHRNNPLELSPLATDHLRKVEDSSESTQNILDDYLREITLLDVTRDSEFSPVGQMSSMDITPVFSPAGHLKAVGGSSDSTEQIMTELGKSDTITNEEMSSTSGSSVQCSQHKQAPSEVTQDISMSSTLENISSSSWASGQKVEKSPNPNEGTRVINITQDLNSSEDTPAQHVGISSASIGRSIPELDSKLCEKPDSVDMEELQTNCVTKVSSNRSPQSREAETDGQEMMKCQNSDESSLCSQSINTTHEINPCCDASAQAANDLSSETDKSIPELKSEIKGHPDSVDAKIIEPPPSCESTGKESEQSLKSDASSNGTFTIEQPSNNTNNATVDLPTADASEQNDVAESGDQQSSGTTKTQVSIVVNQSSSVGKEGTFLIGQNATFDKDSLQKSKIISTFEKTPACVGHRNNTFECKPGSKPNGTVILSEISSSNIPRSTLGNATPPKSSNSTRTLNEGCCEDDSPKLQGKETTAAVEPYAKKDGSPERTSEANPAFEPDNASDGCEIKDLSRSTLLGADSFSDLSNHQSLDAVSIKTNNFNLDETLDLRVDCLTTSTPMPSCKLFNLDSKPEPGKVLAVQKKLYEEPPNKASHTMPSNIVCDRKTFFRQPAAKYPCPPAKTAPQLSKGNPPAAATGLPVKKHRAEGEAMKSAAPSGPQEKPSISSSYNLRSLASKLPVSGLQRPQQSGIPVGLPRAALGLRTRINTAASSSTEKLNGSTAVTKNAQGKRHPLTKGEALPLPKKKKMDTAVPSSGTEAPSSTCSSSNPVRTMKQPTTGHRSAPDKNPKTDATMQASVAKTLTSCDVSSRGRSLKPPLTNQRANLAKPQSQGCAKCSVLEEKIRLQSGEIQRLKEELHKYETSGLTTTDGNGDGQTSIVKC